MTPLAVSHGAGLAKIMGYGFGVVRQRAIHSNTGERTRSHTSRDGRTNNRGPTATRNPAATQRGRVSSPKPRPPLPQLHSPGRNLLPVCSPSPSRASVRLFAQLSVAARVGLGASDRQDPGPIRSRGISPLPVFCASEPTPAGAALWYNTSVRRRPLRSRAAARADGEYE
jgi:hypothetical protein